MKKYFFCNLLIFLTILASSCDENKNARESIVWSGEYHGILYNRPVSITLYNDNSYKKITKGKEIKGIFMWDRTGDIITLDKSGESYLVLKNCLITTNTLPYNGFIPKMYMPYNGFIPKMYMPYNGFIPKMYNYEMPYNARLEKIK